MWVFQALIALQVAFLVWIALYKLSDTTHMYIRKYLFGDKIIYVEGIDYSFQGHWKTCARVSPITGALTAKRYPATNIGTIKLNPNGTGDYCGRILWKVI